jgi:hypothetical protein
LAVLAAFCGSLASAGQVLYWTDAIIGTSAIPGAITLAGDSGVAATSDTDFDSLLTGGTWSGVIIGIQNSSFSSYDGSILGDLTSYVSGGGILIGADWQANDSVFYSLFQASVAGSNAESIANDSSPLFTGITGDIGLTNPGWGIYEQYYTPTGTATGFGPSGSGSGIIQGATGSGTTFLNGPLFDSYTDLSQGEQLIANELGASTAAPEPGTSALLLGSFSVLFLARRKLFAR